jgi:hypothetical protein
MEMIAGEYVITAVDVFISVGILDDFDAFDDADDFDLRDIVGE